ncbi:MAG: ElyC/SanA/YdcF family protein [Patescibacteria group bacterium]
MKIADFFKKYKKVLVGILVVLILFGVIWPVFVIKKYGDKILDVNDVELQDYEVAIVFGAGVKADGKPSDILKDRLITAAELYKNGYVKNILVSGDNRYENYNEPEAMAKYLVEVAGVNEKDVTADFAGRRSFDTCKRAREIFGVEKAILVTQKYHLYRTLFTCNNLGVESVGVDGARQEYRGSAYYMFREILAIDRAFVNVFIWEPNYIGGEKEEL